ncbi:hypothetical protein ZHAS_00007999 [Anopheles sinensis]|uniref:Uncharacterized protein n=1 Tax=Anopheles sinensis TaxID=74873 RepID=A0A084VRB3_ANOSI|nr:hypothetical protein ZHAS_00007999 [Anopheles sinensis]
MMLGVEIRTTSPRKSIRKPGMAWKAKRTEKRTRQAEGKCARARDLAQKLGRANGTCVATAVPQRSREVVGSGKNRKAERTSGRTPYEPSEGLVYLSVHISHALAQLLGAPQNGKLENAGEERWRAWSQAGDFRQSGAGDARASNVEKKVQRIENRPKARPRVGSRQLHRSCTGVFEAPKEYHELRAP